MRREFWPRREQNLDAGTLMPSHQSQGDAVRFSWRKTHAGDQHLHALSILLCVESGHRIGEGGHFIANEPKGIDYLFRESRLVVNHDNAGWHWCILLGASLPCEDGCIIAI